MRENQAVDGGSEKQPLQGEGLKKLFHTCHDIQFTSLKFAHHTVVLIYCSGMINNDILYQTIPENLENFFLKNPGKQSKEVILEGIHLPTFNCIESEEEAISDVFSGKLLLDFGLTGTIFTLDISNRPQRKPEETKTEASIKGPRDDFIEDLATNIALIRKRLKTTSLVTEQLEVGKRMKTKVAILYLKDIAKQEIFQNLRSKLSDLNIDGLFSGVQLEELMNESSFALFPRHHYTGKPDLAVQSLLNARFIILMDGVAYAYVTPVNFFYLLKSSEDKENPYLYNSFERLLRVGGVFVSTFTPGFWVALTTVHQDQIPLTLLATIVESRRGVPLPTALEALIMLLLFELFREAGSRLPTPIGQILSVVGGLIIGDAAISAGLTSPAMIVVIATSTVSTFTLVDQSLVGTVALLRIFVLLFSSFFGLFGIIVSLFIIGSYVTNINVFGVSYLSNIKELKSRTLLKTFFKLPSSEEETIPEELSDNLKKE